MARFARDCMAAFHSLVNKLEVSLGPDTADLDLRIGESTMLAFAMYLRYRDAFLNSNINYFIALAGIHSGPVTAGVLRGERARFQLFG